MQGAELLTFRSHGDGRGNLVAVEGEKDFPFSVQRVYYIYDTAPYVRRGKHAHKKLKQVLICVHGSCKILLDDGKAKETVLLNRPDQGLYMENNLWREMYDFSDDAVLLVLASERYDEADYIRDYSEFLRIKHRNEK